jgi:uncharacterized membrane protein YdbT with pleckstrin-like domain
MAMRASLASERRRLAARARRQETYLAFGIFAAINTVVVVVVYTSGAWLLSSMLATSQRMRSVVLEHTLERSQTAATTLERSQTAANTLEREARSEADAPREHRLERASMLSIERLARRMCLFMSLTLLSVVVHYVGASTRHIPLYYMGSTAAWLFANGGGVVSIVAYSRQAHRADLQRSARANHEPTRRSDCAASARASEHSPARAPRRSTQPFVDNALRRDDSAKSPAFL